MNIDLTLSEIETLKELIREAWIDGYDDEDFHSLYEKLEV